jgi:secreted Zn-dependent insulinase-like peptidase
VKIAELMQDQTPTIEQHIVAFESLTFAEFNELKLRWLANLDFLWLIEGHLTEADALRMVLTTEEAIQFKRIQHEAVPVRRTIKLEPRAVYNFSLTNPDAKNPNAYCRVLF